MPTTDNGTLVRWTRVLLAMGVLLGILTLVGSAYYAFGMDSPSEGLFRVAQAACFTTEGAESVERCAPLTRATVDDQLIAFFSPIGLVSWALTLVMAGLCLGLLVRQRRRTRLPRGAAWTFVLGCGWLLLAPLDKLWDEGYAEGLGDPATAILGQYLPSAFGESSARVWLGSTDSTAQAAGQFVNQAFMLWTLGMLVVAVLWLLRDVAATSRPSPAPAALP